MILFCLVIVLKDLGELQLDHINNFHHKRNLKYKIQNSLYKFAAITLFKALNTFTSSQDLQIVKKV